MLNVESPAPDAFDDDDLSTLTAIADQAAIAIQNVLSYEVEADLRQRAETRARRIEYVQRVGERLKADLDEREVGAARRRRGTRGAGLPHGRPEPCRPARQPCRARTGRGDGRPAAGGRGGADRARLLPRGRRDALFRPEFLLSRSYFIPAEATAVLADSAVPTWTPAIANAGADAWQQGDELLVPLTDHDGGHLLGFLSVDDPESGRRPEQEDAEVLEIFADQAVVALRNARLLAQARRQAARDPVTGLLNYRAAHARLEAELRAARASGQPLGLLTLDMDDFKLINDTHGHPVGDMALRHVAALLERCVRTTDLAARLGGDEFVLILPGASRAESLDVARRLTALSDELALEIAGAGRCRCGSASASPPIPTMPTAPHALLAIADARLYEAKRAGGRAVEAGPRSARARRAGSGDAGDLAGFDMLSALVTAVDNKDRYTGEHSEQVATFACALAEALGLSPRHAAHAAPGRAAARRGQDRRPRPRAAQARQARRRGVGGDETARRPLRHAGPGRRPRSRTCWPRWRTTTSAGTAQGYPQGLAGTEVPLLGRIMIVADAVSAMAMDRPYRRASAPEVIVAELRKGAGSQFDPALVEPFIAAFTRPPGGRQRNRDRSR